jgi:hypothetical protein
MPEGDRVPGTSLLFAKPTYQFASAVLLTAAGVLVLSSLPQSASTPPITAPAEAVNAEAVFTSTPRRPAEEPKSAETPRKPKTAIAIPVPPRKPETPPVHQAAVTAPLSIVPSAEQMETAAPANTGVMGTLRSVGTTVQQLPQRTYSKVASWFSSDAPARTDEPPRPPADVPQNFKAAM